MNNLSQRVKKGILFALFAATISGFSIFYNKLVLVKGVDPLILNIIKNGGVALILSGILILNEKNRALLKSSLKRDIRKLLLIGIVGGSIPFVLFFQGLTMTSAVNAAIIQKTLFLWVGLLAVPLLKEKLSQWQIGGYLLVLYANVFIGGFSGIQLGIGELLVLTATFFWTAEALLAKKILREVDATVLSWARMFFGALFLLAFAFIQGKVHLLAEIQPDYVLPLLGSVGFLTLYVTCYYKALSKAPASLVTAILILSTPITNFLTSGFMTGELSPVLIISTLITLLGIGALIYFLPKTSSHKAKIKHV